MFAWIGKYSMYMWYLHCIFFNNSQAFFKPVLYAPRVPVLVLIWGLALGIVAAWLLEKPVSRQHGQKQNSLLNRKKTVCLQIRNTDSLFLVNG